MSSNLCMTSQQTILDSNQMKRDADALAHA